MMSRRQARKIAQRTAAFILRDRRDRARAMVDAMPDLTDADRELVLSEFDRIDEWLDRLAQS